MERIRLHVYLLRERQLPRVPWLFPCRIDHFNIFGDFGDFDHFINGEYRRDIELRSCPVEDREGQLEKRQAEVLKLRVLERFENQNVRFY